MGMFSDGSSREDALKFRDETLKGYKGGSDVKPSSEAWGICTAQISHCNPVVGFHVESKNGTKVPFQTTAVAAGGNILEAERIARLCWEKLTSGVKRDAVLEYRNQQYKKLGGSDQAPAKKQRTD